MDHGLSRSFTAPASRRMAAIALCAMWLVALPLDVATTQHLAGDQTFTGIGILFLGPLGVLGMVIGWYANPVFLFGLIVALSPITRQRTLLVLAGLIALLAISGLWWNCIPDDSGANPIIARHGGFWLWEATMLAAAAWLATLGLVGDRRALSSSAGRGEA